MFKFLYLIASLYGVVRLYWWIRSAAADTVDLGLALLFIGLGVVYFFEEAKHRGQALAIRYLFGLGLLWTVARWEQPFFMWVIAIFILVTAAIDTFWPG